MLHLKRIQVTLHSLRNRHRICCDSHSLTDRGLRTRLANTRRYSSMAAKGRQFFPSNVSQAVVYGGCCIQPIANLIAVVRRPNCLGCTGKDADWLRYERLDPGHVLTLRYTRPSRETKRGGGVQPRHQSLPNLQPRKRNGCAKQKRHFTGSTILQPAAGFGSATQLCTRRHRPYCLPRPRHQNRGVLWTEG